MWRTPTAIGVRGVLDAMGDPAPAYTTVMTIMGRLYEKRLLSRKTLGKAYLYKARVSESEFLRIIAQRRVRKLVDDFGDVALAQFADELNRAGEDTRRRLERIRDAES